MEQASRTNSRLFLLSQSGKQGLGKAYQNGYHYALDHGYRYALGMDADFSHDPADVPKFLDAIQSADYRCANSAKG